MVLFPETKIRILAGDRWNSNWQQRSLRHLTGISCSFGKSAWCSFNDSKQSENKEWGWRLWLWSLQKLIYLSSPFCSGGNRSFPPEFCQWTEIRNHVPGSWTYVLNPHRADTGECPGNFWLPPVNRWSSSSAPQQERVNQRFLKVWKRRLLCKKWCCQRRML